MNKLTNSFIQDKKHTTKTDRFQPIQPSHIAEVLNNHGFDLVHLKTGRARNADRQDFQTTIARYRSRDSFEIEGLSFDIIFKVPHLYGALQGVLGLFRGVCANQLNVGTHFESVKVKHLGNPMAELDALIPELVAQRAQLVETIKQMREVQVGPYAFECLAQKAVDIRLAQTENVIGVNLNDLTRIRRQADAESNLFTAFNVIQENIFRYGFRYQIESQDINGVPMIRNQTARRVKEESVSAVDLNAQLWDAACSFLKVA